MAKITIMGTGGFGVSLAVICHRFGHEVTLWGKFPDEISEIRLTIQEGKFHQVKRMLSAVDCEVTYLKRIAIGQVALDKELAPGNYRVLTEEEKNKLEFKR